MPHRARKRDDNEAEIVKALLAVGCSVTRLDDAGVPDLLVGRAGFTFLLEVKMPGQGENKRRAIGGRGLLTPSQVKWHDGWKGGEVHIVTSVAEALVAVGCSPDTVVKAISRSKAGI